MSPDPRSPDLLAEIARSAEDLDRGLHGPAREVGALREYGWLRAALPVQFGGLDWGQSAEGARGAFAALFHLGAVSLPATRIYEGHVNAIRLIDRHGTAAQRSRYFAQVRDGALLAIWGADGNAPVRIAADGEYCRLSGTKAFASGLGEVADAIVTATDERGACQMVIVPAGDTQRMDLSAWDVAAMVGTCSGEFTVDAMPATAEGLLGRPGALFVEPDFNGGVWRLCAAYAGAMHAIAKAALGHMRQKGIDQSPTMRQRLGHVAHHAQTALLWSWQACCALELRVGQDRWAERAMAASLFAREAIDHAAAEQMILVERIVGTQLHRRGSALGRQMRDLRLFLRQAALDAKLDAAMSIWSDDALFLFDDIVDAPILPDRRYAG